MRPTPDAYLSFIEMLQKQRDRNEILLREYGLLLAKCIDYIVKHHGEEIAKELLKIDRGMDT